MPVSSSPQLVWQIVRGNHARLYKNITGKRAAFSSEEGNLLNKHSYSHSGLTGDKNVIVASEQSGGLRVSTSRPTKQHQPTDSKNHQVTRKNARRAGTSLGKAVTVYRRDLKRAAQARASALHRAKRGQSGKASKADAS